MMAVTTTAKPNVAADGPLPGMPPAPDTGRAWRAMIWKEARELALPAGLAMAAYGTLLGCVLYRVMSVLADGRGYISDVTAMPDFLMSGGSLIVAPLAAAGLGIMQFFKESRADRFGLLTHRPVSRSMIFWSKAAVGIGMYLAAMMVPLLVATMWASSPSNIPLPFSWSLVLAPLADVMFGLPFYFAGILVARRTDTAWAGSRLVPLVAPVVVLIGDLSAWSFIEALLWAMAGTVLLALSAETYFRAAGQYRQVKTYGKGLTGVALFFGILTLGAVAIALVDVLIQPPNRGVLVEQRTDIRFLNDGSVVIVTLSQNGTAHLRDLAGKDLATMSSNEMNSDPKYRALTMSAIGDYWGAELQQPRLHDSRAYFDDEQGTILHGSRWFRAMPKTGSDYLVGFEPIQRIRVGVIGAKGFEAGIAVPSQRLAHPMHVLSSDSPMIDGNGGYSLGVGTTLPVSHRPMISAGDTLYVLDSGQKLEEVYKTAGQEAIVALGTTFTTAASEKPNMEVKDFYPVVVTGKSVTILMPLGYGWENEQGKSVATRSGPAKVFARFEMEGLEKYRVLSTSLPGTSRFVLNLSPWDASEYNKLPGLAVFFKEDGTVERKEELPWLGYDFTSGETAVEMYGPALAPPVGIAAVMGTMAWARPEDYARQMPEMSEALTLSSGLGVVMAVATFALAWRRQMGKGAFLWGTLALLLGPAALLLMLTLRGLPVTEVCKFCGTRRAVGLGTCGKCGTGWEMPGRNGTEIFV